jgi:hypothetical protein
MTENPKIEKCSPSLALARTMLMLGCYRKGDASDPQIYAGAVAAVLADYPPAVVLAVTDPAHGLPTQGDWMPTIAEVKRACEALMGPFYREQERERRRRETADVLGRAIDGQKRLAAASADEAARQRAIDRWENEIRPQLQPKPKQPVFNGRDLMAMGGLTEAEWDALPSPEDYAQAARLGELVRDTAGPAERSPEAPEPKREPLPQLSDAARAIFNREPMA